MKIILTLMVLFLSVLGRAEDKQPRYEPMDQKDLIQWYTVEVLKSITEDAQYMSYIALIALSQELSCFDVIISTEPIERGNPFWHPTWYIDGTNCVDERTYNCEGNNEK